MIILTLIMLDCSIKIKIAILQKQDRKVDLFLKIFLIKGSNENKNYGLYETSFF